MNSNRFQPPLRGLLQLESPKLGDLLLPPVDGLGANTQGLGDPEDGVPTPLARLLEVGNRIGCLHALMVGVPTFYVKPAYYTAQ